MRQPGSLCHGNEAALFQCRAGGGRVDVCGGTDPSGRRYAQYRTGEAGHVASVYPERAGDSSPIRWAIMGYAGGGEIQYRFTKGGRDYIIYDRVVRDEDRLRRPIPRFEAGVVVRLNGVTRSHLHCDNPEENRSYSRSEDFMPEGEFVFFDE